MCGIAGIVGTETPQQAMIEAMTQALAHRGPDAQGCTVKPHVGLGHRRLSIIDLSDAAHQPMSDPTGRYTIVYNGEVYNFASVKALLGDYAYQSNSDTDVILAAYIKWGPACLQHFNGMFAFAIWDAVENRLFIARDRLGIKPLYYYQVGARVLFASEVRSLLVSGCVPKRLNRQALPTYLQYYSVNAPATLIEGVQQLPAGYYGIWDNGQFQLERYWHPAKAAPNLAEASYDTVRKGVRDRLQAAIARRLVSDVPLGAFLSGGIDSSAVVALMASVSDQPVHTFSIIFKEKQYDESQWSQLIAQTYQTEHHPIQLNPDDFLAELPAALAAMDHPSGDGLNSYVVSQATRKEGFTVALSGLGGDELFAGYPVFKQMDKLASLKAFYALPQGLRRLGSQAIGTVYRNHKTARLKELLSLPQNRFRQLYPIFRKIYHDYEIPSLLAQSNGQLDVWQGLFSDADLDQIEQLPLFSQVSVGEIFTYTQNVLLRDTDQMSMAHALEVRVPFFDHELVEYAWGIPDKHKFPTYAKKLLVEAMGELLPSEIVHRPKMGFVFPWEVWMRGPLQSFCDQHMHRLACRGLFKGEEIHRIWQGFLAGDKHILWIKVWLLVVLEDWMHRHDIEG